MIELIIEEEKPVELDISEQIIERTINDYNKLVNKPTLNGFEIVGAMEEQDPTVPNWAKEPNKPTYTSEEVGALPDTTDLSVYAKNEVITDVWDPNKTYAVGSYCIYSNSLWKCLVQNGGQIPTEGTYWTKASIDDELISLKGDLAKETKNLADIRNTKIGVAWNNSSNKDRASLYITVTPNTEYTISFKSGFVDGVYWYEKAMETDSTLIYGTEVQNGKTLTTKENTNVVCIGFNKTDVNMHDIELLLLQVEKGSVATSYIKPYTACDAYLRDYAITYVTPEMFGAYGDGVHDDTLALQTALDTGKTVIANGSYLTTATLKINGKYEIGQKFEFGKIIYTGNSVAIECNGRNGIVKGTYIRATKGSCVYIGNKTMAYNWDIDINFVRADGATAFTLGGGGIVSEINITSTRVMYWTNGVYLNVTNEFVGQITFRNMTFDCMNNPNGSYAFFTNASAGYGMTGINLFGVSLEGAKGGFNFVNSNISRPIQNLGCYGLRTSELTVVNGYNLLRLTGNGIMNGDIFTDICDLDKIDVSQHSPDWRLAQCIKIHGRLTYKGIGWQDARIVGKKIFPTINTGFAEVVDPTYGDSNFPVSVNKIGGNATFNLTFPFDGEIKFIARTASTKITINGTEFSMPNKGDTLSVSTTVTASYVVKVVVTNGNETTVLDLV